MTLDTALAWADSHGLLVPAILGAITVAARVAWGLLRPVVLRRAPGAVPLVEGAALRVAALLPDLLGAILRRPARVIVVDSPRPTTAPPAPSGQSGSAVVGALVIAAALGLAAPAACRPARDAIVDTQSPRVDCRAGSQRCHNNAPEVCSAMGRWWAALPVAPDGTPRVCADVCEVRADGVAHCASSTVVIP
jgi:hypothetical protein